MHEEFALHYEKKWLERFGLVTYGCCEQLHEKVDILSKIPNLRKISMSCWIDVDRAVEKMAINMFSLINQTQQFLLQRTGILTWLGMK